MPIIQKPDTLNHSATLSDIINSGPNSVQFVLKTGTTTIIEETYLPDAEGRLKIRLRDLVHDLLFAVIPGDNTIAFEQQSIWADYVAELNSILGYKYRVTNLNPTSVLVGITFLNGQFVAVTFAPFETRELDARRVSTATPGTTVEVLETIYDPTEISFRVLKGYLQRQPFNLDYFLKSNWLTQQPRTKILKLQDPEWLNCYTPVACSVKVQATYDDDTMQLYNLVDLDAEKYYSIDVRPGRIASMSVKKLVAYEVWTEAGGIQTRYKQAYWITDQYYDYYDVFLFENRFGGIDSIVFTGQLTRRDSIVVESAVFDEETFDYFVDPDLTIEKHTGYFLSPQHRNHALDFLRSKQKYHIVGGKPVRISVSATQYESIDGQLNSFPFTFRYSDVKDNIPNLGTTLNNLTIQ